MEDLSKIFHPTFQYVFIPVDISDEVDLKSFSGYEEKFSELMRDHFNRDILSKKNKDSFADSLKNKYFSDHNQPSSESHLSLNDKFDHNSINSLITNSSTYQIIPLILPSKSNCYKATNAYIDDIGRVKELEKNARASQICSTDIRGDCFISSSYDDDNDFKRIDFTLKDYQRLLTNPPSAKNRWDQSKVLEQLINKSNANNTVSDNKPFTENSLNCANCGKSQENLKVSGENRSLMTCSRCHRTKYCCVSCQKSDWKYHKRICH